MNAYRTIERLISYWALFGGALLLLIVFATALNAAGFTLNSVMRLFDGSFPGLSGYEDAVTLLVGVAALAMFPYCQLHSGHAVVDVFMQNASGAINRVVHVVSCLLICGVAIWFAYMSLQGAIQMREDNIETAVLGWSVWGFAATAVLSCLLWALAAVIQMFEIENGA